MALITSDLWLNAGGLRPHVRFSKPCFMENTLGWVGGSLLGAQVSAS